MNDTNNISAAPQKEIWFSKKEIDVHVKNFGRGSSKGKSHLEESLFAHLEHRSPAKAAYCKTLFKSMGMKGEIHLPRGCHTNTPRTNP
jgi:hypothetical protein